MATVVSGAVHLPADRRWEAIGEGLGLLGAKYLGNMRNEALATAAENLDEKDPSSLTRLLDDANKELGIFRHVIGVEPDDPELARLSEVYAEMRANYLNEQNINALIGAWKGRIDDMTEAQENMARNMQNAEQVQAYFEVIHEAQEEAKRVAQQGAIDTGITQMELDHKKWETKLKEAGMSARLLQELEAAAKEGDKNRYQKLVLQNLGHKQAIEILGITHDQAKEIQATDIAAVATEKEKDRVHEAGMQETGIEANKDALAQQFGYDSALQQNRLKAEATQTFLQRTHESREASLDRMLVRDEGRLDRELAALEGDANRRVQEMIAQLQEAGKDVRHAKDIALAREQGDLDRAFDLMLLSSEQAAERANLEYEWGVRGEMATLDREAVRTNLEYSEGKEDQRLLDRIEAAAKEGNLNRLNEIILEGMRQEGSDRRAAKPEEYKPAGLEKKDAVAATNKLSSYGINLATVKPELQEKLLSAAHTLEENARQNQEFMQKTFVGGLESFFPKGEEQKGRIMAWAMGWADREYLDSIRRENPTSWEDAATKMAGMLEGGSVLEHILPGERFKYLAGTKADITEHVIPAFRNAGIPVEESSLKAYIEYLRRADHPKAKELVERLRSIHHGGE